MSTSAPEPDAERRLEIYKLAVEMADRTSARRAGANNFFFTLHVALAAFIGVVSSARKPSPHGNLPTFDAFGLVLTSVAGIVLSVTWWATLRYYRRLNGAKFNVINEIETRLPERPYTEEWKILHPTEPLPLQGQPAPSRSMWRRRNHHREATVVEQVVPFVFAGIYLALGIRVIWK